MASDDIKAKMTRARDLIQDKRYDEARAVLRTIDHPTATEWLAKLDQIAPLPAAQTPTFTAQSAPDWVAAAASTPAVTRSKLPFFGLILLILISIAGGIGVGVLLGFTAVKIIYLIFASVILAAALGGALLTVAVQLGKVRAGAVIWIFGAIMGLLIYSTYRYIEYADFREIIRQEIYNQEPSADPELVEQFIDIDVLKAETGSEGFVGFTLLQAQEGMTVTRASSTNDSSGITLSRELTIGYWVLEILIALIVPGAIGRGAATRPFCEDTNKWLKFNKLGLVGKDSIEPFMNALQQGDFQQAGSYVQTKNPRGLPKLTVETGRCQDQSPDGRLKVTAQKPGRNNTEEVLNTVIPSAGIDALIRSKQ